MSVSGEQSCPDNHSSFRCAAANKACNAQTSASSCVTSGTGICDIVIRMSGNAFCSCSLNVFSSRPVRETVRESSESGELPAVRFPPPPSLETSDCLWLPKWLTALMTTYWPSAARVGAGEAQALQGALIPEENSRAKAQPEDLLLAHHERRHASRILEAVLGRKGRARRPAGHPTPCPPFAGSGDSQR